MRISIAQAFINSARVAIRAKANDLASLHLNEARAILRTCEMSPERTHLHALCTFTHENLAAASARAAKANPFNDAMTRRVALAELI